MLHSGLLGAFAFICDSGMVLGFSCVIRFGVFWVCVVQVLWVAVSVGFLSFAWFVAL